MNISNLKILFLISKASINKQGNVSIRCRITFNSVRKIFSTGLSVKSIHWDNKAQEAKPPSDENTFINNQLTLIRNKINQGFLLLQLQGKEFDVEDVYMLYKGESPKEEKTILQVFKEHNEQVEKLIGKDYVRSTHLKFVQASELIKDFIRYRFKKHDFYFKDLELKFVQDYEFYLKTEKNLSQVTANKMIQRFRKMVKIAIGEGYINRDPFILYKVKRTKKEVVFLTTEELYKLKKHTFSQSRLQYVKDMFVFCCYTGLAFNEMSKLEEKHIINGFDGNKWIKIIREKTHKEVSIPLLPEALSIINKNQYVSQSENRLFQLISNQKFNSYLKEIAEIVGIEKRLTHHIARKTFATTVLLYNDVPMEIVSELLGHSKMSITQEHYGKVVQKKVSEHMLRLHDKLKENGG
ncbi:site-specific integrase [uncultured Flavobacterium sp.]|uniref:site-specific integrase n=1 Tax=uncultured Flavobacterium sp. TaxID=165435 RepID=UPI0027E17881|nr:site-specific integrase [uncultured Flavobacterium sp.]